MSDHAAREILVVGAAALAHGDALEPGLQLLLDAIAGHLDVASAAILIPGAGRDRLAIAASFGLPDSAVAGLAAAVGNPGHPIARTFANPVASFDVLPTAPGGPALRSHVPLVVRRHGVEVVFGVLALAHDRPIDPGMHPVLLAGADLAAVAIERSRAL
jgi:hypothetical protein